ncbi:MAG: hypothetical protein K9N48_09310 [Verrucomicrobia bacterium]|nr:hypothetical protein [Verrucomicrobiota bacterium]
MSNANQTKEPKRGATKWDFGIQALRIFWNILDRGFLLPILLVFGIGMVFIVLLRMPPDQIAPSIERFLDLFGDRLVLCLIFIVILACVVIMWRYEVRIYRKECKRLGEEKSYWIHARPLSEHRSSEYEWENKVQQEGNIEYPD